MARVKDGEVYQELRKGSTDCSKIVAKAHDSSFARPAEK